MNHATSAIAAPDTGAVQVGDAVWQGPARRAPGSKCGVAGACYEVLVLAQDGHEIPQIPYQDLVQSLDQRAEANYETAGAHVEQLLG
jgi:hypothetical protein